MEKLTKKQLRKSMNLLLELAKCPNCQKTLTLAAEFCVNGHAACTICRQGLQECPTCHGAFSNFKPTGFIHQVLEAIPHPCRYQDCTHFVKPNGDHEKFCIAKPTDCKYCGWVGPARDFGHHLTTDHPLEGHHNKSKGLLPFDLEEKKSIFSLVYEGNVFFWWEIKIDPRVGMLLAVVHTVTRGKTNSVFSARVSFIAKSKKNYSASLTLDINPDADPYKDNCISVPLSILSKYKTVDNDLNYEFLVTKHHWESVCCNVKSKIKIFHKMGIYERP